MSQRPRKARSPKFDALGERGRVTGTVIQSAPITEEGVEDYEAFFASPRSTAAAQSKAKPSTARKNNANKASLNVRRQERPDKADDLGFVGRKTGVAIKGAPRNSQGIEDIDAFYKSPTEPSHTAARPARSSAKAAPAAEADTPSQPPAKRARREQTPPEPEQDESDDMGGFDVPPYNDDMLDYDGPDEESFDAAPTASTSKATAAPASENDLELSDDEPSTIKTVSKPSAKAKPKATASKLPKYSPPSKAKAKPASWQAAPASDPFAVPDANGFDVDAGAGQFEDSLEYEEPAAVDAEAGDEGQEGEEGSPPQASKAKKAKSASAKGKGKAQSESQLATAKKTGSAGSKKRKWDSVEPDSVRRSNRQSVKPLEYWRCERIVYTRRASGPQPHYGMSDIVRIPKDDPKPLAGKRRGGRAGSKLKSIKEEDGDGEDYAGWDDSTDPEGLVWDYVAQDEVRRRIAFTGGMVQTKPAASKTGGKPAAGYRFQKIFTDGDFMAGGVLEIPVNEKKPLKPARDNTYMIFCSRGAVRVLVYRTTFTIAKGGFFLVPRGNSYEIENIGNSEAQLVFMQAREIRITEEMAADE